MSVLKERLKLEEKESLALLNGRRFPAKDHKSLSVGRGEKADTPEVESEDKRDS